MVQVLQPMGSSGTRQSVSRDMRRSSMGYGRVGQVGNTAQDSRNTSSVSFRVARKLRISKLGGIRSRASNEGGKGSTSKIMALLGRLRDMYVRMMRTAASKSGENSVIPVAKASRAPPSLEAAFSSWALASAFAPRRGSKISDLDPGFKMTAVERKYVEHLKRTVSSRTF